MANLKLFIEAKLNKDYEGTKREPKTKWSSITTEQVEN